MTTSVSKTLSANWRRRWYGLTFAELVAATSFFEVGFIAHLKKTEKGRGKGTLRCATSTSLRPLVTPFHIDHVVAPEEAGACAVGYVVIGNIFHMA